MSKRLINTVLEDDDDEEEEKPEEKPEERDVMFEKLLKSFIIWRPCLSSGLPSDFFISFGNSA